jgi:hypothetical protein
MDVYIERRVVTEAVRDDRAASEQMGRLIYVDVAPTRLSKIHRVYGRTEDWPPPAFFRHSVKYS